MAFKTFKNKTRFVAATYGVDDFVVGVAADDCITPAQSNAIDGKTYRYYAQSADGEVWEMGSGPYNAAFQTLARTEIEASSSDDGVSKVDFALSPVVDVFAPGAETLEPWVKDHATLAKTSAYTVLRKDYGSLIKCSGTFTLSLDAAAALGDKFKFYFRNTGAGVVTLDPNGSEVVNGYATYPLFPGESCEIFCDGAAFWTAGLGTGEVLMNTATASNSATIDFTNLPHTWFSEYRVSITDVAPVTAGAVLGLRGSLSGAFQQNATDYDTSQFRFDNLSSVVGGDVATFGYVALTAGQPDIATNFLGPLTGDVHAKSMDGSGPPRWTWRTSYFNVGSEIVNLGGGTYRSGASMDGMRFFYTADSIASGVFRLHGIRR